MLLQVQTQILTAVFGGLLGVLFNFIIRDVFWSKIENMRDITNSYDALIRQISEINLTAKEVSAIYDEDSSWNSDATIIDTKTLAKLKKDDLTNYRNSLREHAASPHLELSSDTTRHMASVEGVLMSLEGGDWVEEQEEIQKRIDTIDDRCGELKKSVKQDKENQTGKYRWII